jgi:CheY-like chemotaxis protein
MRNPIEILSLEDDPLQAEWIRQTIESGVAGSKVNHVGTESEFVARFPGIVAAPPTLILMDVMLRWADPSPNIPERPADVKKGGMRRAGLRCCTRLAANPKTRVIPVILYTVLQSSELTELEKELDMVPPNLLYVQKDSNPAELLKNIRELERGV